MDNNSPSPFVEFRFEDSLRKYENLPRKKVKKSHEKCSQWPPRHSLLASQQRISRIYDSRRKYISISIEKPSSHSKLKSNRRDIVKKQISQFMGESISCGGVETNNFWDKIHLNYKETELIPNYEEFKSKVIDELEERNNIIRQKIKAEMEKICRDRCEKIDLQIESIEALKQELCKQIFVLFQDSSREENQAEPSEFQLSIHDQSSSNFNYSKESDLLSQQKLLLTQNQKISEQIPSDNQFLKENILFNGGRVKVENAADGQDLFLSTRILTRVVQTENFEEAKKKYPSINKVIFQYICKIIQDIN